MMERDEVVAGRTVRVVQPDGEPVRDTVTNEPLAGTINAIIDGGLIEVLLRNPGSEGIIRAFSHHQLAY